MKKIFAGSWLLLIAACTPPEQTYCDRFGLAQGNSEYQKCLNYYFQQQAAFNADRQVCDFEADKTYPPTLYDNGRWERVHGSVGFNQWGSPTHGGGFGTSVYVEPDYYRNRQVDSLRMRIIQPCMESRGWKSGETWQAGRITGGDFKKVPAPIPQQGGKLPWLK